MTYRFLSVETSQNTRSARLMLHAAPIACQRAKMFLQKAGDARVLLLLGFRAAGCRCLSYRVNFQVSKSPVDTQARE
jgi:Fe-S cluster assembly iron-binding protein IscA